jgi:YVTN family beta-propeller protein
MKRVSTTQRAGLRVLAVAAILVLASHAGVAQGKSQVAKSAKVHDGVYEIVVSQTSGNVYVAAIGKRGENTGSVLTLDPDTLAVKSKVDVSAQAAFGLAINDKTQMLYTSNTRAGNVSAIDLKTGKTVAVIGDPAEPKAHTFKVLADEVNNLVYVSIASKAGKIWVIDGKTNTLAQVIEKTGVTTVGMAIDPNTGKLYAANLGANEIAEIDPKTRQVLRRFPAGGERPTQMVIDGKTSRLFVTNQGSGDISVLDTRTGNLIRTVKTGAGALGIGFNPSNNRVYVANRQAGTVSVVNAETYAVEASLAAGSLPNTVAINPKTNATYVTNKAKSGPRDAPPVDDPSGDTVTLITGK